MNIDSVKINTSLIMMTGLKSLALAPQFGAQIKRKDKMEKYCLGLIQQCSALLPPFDLGLDITGPHLLLERIRIHDHHLHQLMRTWVLKGCRCCSRSGPAADTLEKSSKNAQTCSTSSLPPSSYHYCCCCCCCFHSNH